MALFVRLMGSERPAREGRLDPRWEQLYEAYWPQIFRATSYLLGQTEAEEVVHDAFERGMRQDDFFSNVAAPEAWLHAVAMRLAISRLRRQAAWRRVLGRYSAEQDASPPDVELHDALRRLPPSDRVALVLRYYLRSDYGEIARALGVRERSVGPILTRARSRLRKELT